jgi:ribosomal protein S18 acetylase RimI-like enzyme
MLLIVNRNHQGKGIGKELLKSFVDHLKKREGKRFDLFTDTETSFDFYDK